MAQLVHHFGTKDEPPPCNSEIFFYPEAFFMLYFLINCLVMLMERKEFRKIYIQIR